MTSEEKILIARIEDKARQCSDNSMITNSVFLDMHERSVVSSANIDLNGAKMFFYGGFGECERSIALFMPEYITEEPAEYFEKYPDDEPLAIVEISKDRFSPALGHRDYLGAMMALGIKREMTGDIVVDESGCKIAVLTKLAPFIAENLGKAGRGTLKAKIIHPCEVKETAKAVGVHESFTVSSVRLDSIIKNAFHLSRGAAVEAIESGIIYVNDVECAKSDRKITAGDKIVFRRKGRIIINRCSEVTKKGRIIVEIKKFQ